MNLFTIACKSVRYRKFVTIMTMITIGLSCALLVGVERVRESGKESFGGAISQVDLVVGPRTSPFSLLMYAVFRLGSPMQSLSPNLVEKYAKHEAVAWVAPFSLGDGYKGFPVVGVDERFFTHYHYGSKQAISLKDGEFFKRDSLSAVLGHNAASETKVKVGDKIVVSHGHSQDGDGFETHADDPLTVTGILAPTGTPIDRAVWITLNAMAVMHDDGNVGGGDHASEHAPDEHAHEHEYEHEDEHEHKHEPSDHKHDKHEHDKHDQAKEVHEHHDHDHATAQVSGFFVGTKNRSAALQLSREINESTGEALTAIMPAVVLNEFWRTLAVGEKALSLISMMVAVVTLCGMLVSLQILAATRKREIHILRAAGASSKAGMVLLSMEAFVICLLGLVFGYLLLYASMFILGPMITAKYGLALSLYKPTSYEWIYCLVLLIGATTAGLIPAFKSLQHQSEDL
jgi:putative ABC transport system permease protein